MARRVAALARSGLGRGDRVFIHYGNEQRLFR